MPPLASTCVPPAQMFDLGGASSLTAMGTVVGAAVGGVSQAVTSVASTAETGWHAVAGEPFRHGRPNRLTGE